MERRPDVVEHFLEILDPERKPNNKRMKRHRHNPTADRAFCVKGVELIADHAVVFFRRVIFPIEDANIIDSLLVGNHDHAAGFNSNGRRLIIARPIADIFKSCGSEMIGCVKRLDQAWTEPTFRRLSSGIRDRFHDFTNHLALFIFRVTTHVPAIGLAVPEPFPLSLVAFFNDRRVILADVGVEQNTRPHAVLIENIHQAIDANASAIVAQ